MIFQNKNLAHILPEVQKLSLTNLSNKYLVNCEPNIYFEKTMLQNKYVSNHNGAVTYVILIART